MIISRKHWMAQIYECIDESVIADKHNDNMKRQNLNNNLPMLCSQIQVNDI